MRPFVPLLVAALASLLSAPAGAAPRKKAPPRPAAELVAINRHETFTLKPGPQGGFTRQTMRAFARFLRCHHTQRVHAMSERLARLLYEVASHFEFARLEVVAGYRAPKVAKEKGNPKSPHKRGEACDFRVAGVANEVVRDYLRHFPRVGVGYYPNSGFVHLDVHARGKKQSAFWVDYSRPGERAQYSPSPDEDLRREAQKAETASVTPEGAGPQGGEGAGADAPILPALIAPTAQKDE